MNETINQRQTDTKTSAFPPRVIRKFIGNQCIEPVSKHYIQHELQSAVRDVEYLSAEEHQAILAKHIDEGYEWSRKELNAKDAEIAKLQARCEKQQGIIEEYAMHLDKCAVYLGHSDHAECNCGLKEALAEWKAGKCPA